MPKPTREELEHRFRYHASKYDSVKRAHEEISERCLNLAEVICRFVPEGRGLALALTALEDVRMRANMGIALDQDAVENTDAAAFGRMSEVKA